LKQLLGVSKTNKNQITANIVHSKLKDEQKYFNVGRREVGCAERTSLPKSKRGAN
jgi:hypothetical protein